MQKDQWTKQDRWTQVTDTATRLHLRLLKFLTGALTLFLWLVFGTGIWAVNRMIRFPVFGDFFGYIKQPSVILSLILFGLSYAGLFAALFWLCIVCRRLRIAKRIVVWCLLWIPFLNWGLGPLCAGAGKTGDRSQHLPDPSG